MYIWSHIAKSFRFEDFDIKSDSNCAKLLSFEAYYFNADKICTVLQRKWKMIKK